MANNQRMLEVAILTGMCNTLVELQDMQQRYLEHEMTVMGLAKQPHIFDGIESCIYVQDFTHAEEKQSNPQLPTHC